MDLKKKQTEIQLKGEKAARSTSPWDGASLDNSPYYMEGLYSYPLLPHLSDNQKLSRKQLFSELPQPPRQRSHNLSSIINDPTEMDLVSPVDFVLVAQ